MKTVYILMLLLNGNMTVLDQYNSNQECAASIPSYARLYNTEVSNLVCGKVLK